MKLFDPHLVKIGLKETLRLDFGSEKINIPTFISFPFSLYAHKKQSDKLIKASVACCTLNTILQ
jgi:hypothetical protein